MSALEHLIAGHWKLNDEDGLQLTDVDVRCMYNIAG
jgi:hypothetical protein